LAVVIGTRPEAIKLAPVVLKARERGSGLRPVLISTGQQPRLVSTALGVFGLVADYDLAILRRNQALGQAAARCLGALSRLLAQVDPAMVIVQGDTTSAVAGAMAGFYAHIPVAHVEAGLRTRDVAAPFPEEANRQLIARLARLQFAPTPVARANLVAEGIDPSTVMVTGNTVVDALELLRARFAPLPPALPAPAQRKRVLVTMHRRENLPRALERVCKAMRKLAAVRPELEFVFVLHPNPAVSGTARARLSGRARITLLAPLPYLEMLQLVADSWLVLTDSGGLQEEAPSLGRPVLVLRDSTERVEGLTCGAARLIGTAPDRIMAAIEQLLDSPLEYARLVPQENPYGDGQAAQRIVSALRGFLLHPVLAAPGPDEAARARRRAIGLRPCPSAQ
jgi:UDP-N-acetylglucosamine 2-epimerase (non-hydrolysing)